MRGAPKPYPEVSLGTKSPSRLLDEKKRAQAWTERSIGDFLPRLNFFVECVGNIPVDQLNRDTMRGFKAIVDKLPARYSQTEYRNLTLKQLMASNIPMDKRISPASLSKYYGAINS